ncbi:MAG: hypothetical protein HKN32_00275, partial [Flavobacteriales bacterium]|nr:hypothetical protein [Flavobacteriales bacterium]
MKKNLSFIESFGRTFNALAVVMLLAFAATPVFAQEHGESHVAEEHTQDTPNHEAKGEFKPGDLIMSHIADSHEWHMWG